MWRGLETVLLFSYKTWHRIHMPTNLVKLNRPNKKVTRDLSTNITVYATAYRKHKHVLCTDWGNYRQHALQMKSRSAYAGLFIFEQY